MNEEKDEDTKEENEQLYRDLAGCACLREDVARIAQKYPWFAGVCTSRCPCLYMVGTKGIRRQSRMARSSNKVQCIGNNAGV